MAINRFIIFNNDVMFIYFYKYIKIMHTTSILARHSKTTQPIWQDYVQCDVLFGPR